MLKGIFCLLCAVSFVKGHGRLWDPPSRSSMFRRGFKTPPNYNDNQLSCGGYSYQWGKNGGKCGICGDPYDQKRENEAGGKYATGIISAKYKKGQPIKISVDVTANHRGWFEFRLCPNNNVKKPVTQSCLDQNLLQLADGSGTRDYIDSIVGMRTKTWLLPTGLTCTQCVLQWKWHVGNSWGRSVNGTGCIGCGPQEEFYGCADIAIEDSNGSVVQTTQSSVVKTTQPPPPPTTTSTTTTTTTTPTTTTTSTTTTTPTTTTTSTTTTTPTTTTPTTTNTPTTTTTTTTMPTTIKSMITSSSGKSNQNINKPAKNLYLGKKCEPTLVWQKTPGMRRWCNINCRANFCPPTHCKCT